MLFQSDPMLVSKNLIPYNSYGNKGFAGLLPNYPWKYVNSEKLKNMLASGFGNKMIFVKNIIYFYNQTLPITSSNDTPVRVATNVRVMKLIERDGLI